MAEHLITLEPMGPYFFGGERTFGFGRKNYQKAPYYIVSEKIPSQPTLFGALRYIILSQNNALWGQPNESRAEAFVGKESFSFAKAISTGGSNETLSFGLIKSISPLFLVKGSSWYVRTPYDHDPGKRNAPNTEYTPFKMKGSEVIFGSGSKSYPEDYKAKNGCGGGYVSLDDLSIVKDEDIFKTVVKTGINSHRTELDTEIKDDNGSFFKKEKLTLINGFKFAFIAGLADETELSDGIVFMGQDRSPFRFTVTAAGATLQNRAEKAFAGKHRVSIQYALSDILPLNDRFPDDVDMDFYIADTKVIRNLETKSFGGNDPFVSKLKCSDNLYRVMKAGSVFYTDDDISGCSAFASIGMNITVRI